MEKSNRPETAAEAMRGGLNCAQAVAKTYAAEAGLDEQTAARLMATFGAGMGRSGLVCGAISGAALVLGAKFGNADPADTARRDKAYAAAAGLVDAFRREHGTVLCRELTGFDLRDAQQLQRAREQGVFADRCPVFVKTAAAILEEMLAGG
jgi:C_GCAxxG_C_C family probable redox protein